MKYTLNLLKDGDLSQLIGEADQIDPVEAVKTILNDFPFFKTVKNEEIEIKPINDVNFQVFIGEEEYLLSKNIN